MFPKSEQMDKWKQKAKLLFESSGSVCMFLSSSSSCDLYSPILPPTIAKDAATLTEHVLYLTSLGQGMMVVTRVKNLGPQTAYGSLYSWHTSEKRNRVRQAEKWGIGAGMCLCH